MTLAVKIIVISSFLTKHQRIYNRHTNALFTNNREFFQVNEVTRLRSLKGLGKLNWMIVNVSFCGFFRQISQDEI